MRRNINSGPLGKLEEDGSVSSKTLSLGIPVSLQVASTNTQASNTQLRCCLPKVFGSLFYKCGSHSAVDNTGCLFRPPLDALSTKKQEARGGSGKQNSDTWGGEARLRGCRVNVVGNFFELDRDERTRGLFIPECHFSSSIKRDSKMLLRSNTESRPGLGLS